MFDVITAPLIYGFMQRGLAAAILVGIVCSVIGCYIVLRGMAFLGDAMAHAILPGVAVAYLLRGNLLVGALAAAILVALGIGTLTRGSSIKEDTAIGILFAASLALGVAMISSLQSYATDLSHILFGNILGVSNQDLLLCGILGAAVLVVVVMLYKEFLLVAFDPVLAATLRLPAGAINALLLVLIAVTVVISLQTVGVGLVTALLVTPAATARLITRRLGTMMLLSAAFGVISAVVGLYFSYYVNIASGPAIVLTATAIFLLVFLFAPAKGVLPRMLRRLR
ncbi:MAG: metal ABC transporter permease [Chloroflexi bacterium]|nr:metal ABC transporter permease [Chloroflexota bacterium]